MKSELEQRIRSFLHNIVNQQEKLPGNLYVLLSKLYPYWKDDKIHEVKEKILSKIKH